MARFIIAADAASFDETAFKAALAAQFDGVTPNEVQLTISAASVLVTAEVILPTIADAEVGAALLTTSGMETLSAALGVSVGGVSDVNVLSLAFDAPSPPPPSPPPPSPPPPLPPSAPPSVPSLVGNLSAALSIGSDGDSQTWLFVLLVVVGVCVLLSVGYMAGRASGKRRADANNRGTTVAIQSIGIAMTSTSRPARCKVAVVNSVSSTSSTADMPMSPLSTAGMTMPPRYSDEDFQDFDMQKI